MRHRTGVIALMAAILMPLVTLTMSTPPAWADQICNNIFKGYTGFTWTHTTSGNEDVDGVRAPIQLRKDGDLCDNSNHPDSFDSTWIAVDEKNAYGNRIAQIGFIKQWDGNTQRYCKVWAIGTGTSHAYDCGLLTDKTNYFFKIHTWNNDTQYVIADCGTSGSYDPADCTVKDSSMPVIAHNRAQIYSEVKYACGLHIMGADVDKQNVGTSASHIQGLTKDNKWMARDSDLRQ